MSRLIEDITGTKPMSLHHDISTLTGEQIVVFTLAETPCSREAKEK
ncbi:MAG: Na-translocating system protein MpsC family protein [Pirellulaceae bacterium]